MALCGVSWSAAGRNYVDVACLAVVASQGAPPGWAAVEARLVELDAVATLMEPGDDPADALRQALTPPEWHSWAACRGQGVEDHFPERGRTGEAARAICAGCPVTGECLDAALADPFTEGIWAGTTASERVQLRRARAA